MSTDDDSLDVVRRTKSSRKNVDYGDTIDIHASSRKRVEFVPFFIERSAGTDFSCKLTTYSQKESGWIPTEDGRISLKEPAARRLLEALRVNLAVAEKDTQGEFLLVPLDGEATDLAGYDSTEIAAALLKVLSEPSIRDAIDDIDLPDGLLGLFADSIRLQNLENATNELAAFLEDGTNDERTYQRWCERHSWAFGSRYLLADRIRNIGVGDSVDLLLPGVTSGFRDVVELKRPDMDVLRFDPSHKSFYFSADVSKTIGQCHRYLDVLHVELANGLRDYPEVVGYHPRAIVVIGRSCEWEDDRVRALHGLNQRLSGVVVMTYDQLLAQARRHLEIVRELQDS